MPRCAKAADGKWNTQHECEAFCADKLSLGDIGRIVAMNSDVTYAFGEDYNKLMAEQNLLYMRGTYSGDTSLTSAGPVTKHFKKYRASGGHHLIKELINDDMLGKRYLESQGVKISPHLTMAFAKIDAGNTDFAKALIARSGEVVLPTIEHRHRSDRGITMYNELERLRKNLNSAISYAAKYPDESTYVDLAVAIKYNIIDTGIDEDTYLANKIIHRFYAENVIEIDETKLATIIPLSLIFFTSDTDREGHVNSLIIVGPPGQWVAFAFEPHTEAEWSSDVNSIVRSLFKDFFERHSIKYSANWTSSCPRGLQSQHHNDYGSCQTWSIFVTAMCILNPTMAPNETLRLLMQFGNKIGDVLELFSWELFCIIERGQLGGIPKRMTRAIDAAMRTATAQLETLRRLYPENSYLTKLRPMRTWAWADSAVIKYVENFCQQLAKVGEGRLSKDGLLALISAGHINEALFVEPLLSIFGPPNQEINGIMLPYDEVTV